ncbi:MAG: S9 family peptidase [Saprospiraceae bacterium]
MEKTVALPGNPALPSTAEEIAALAAHAPQGMRYSVEDFFRVPAQTAFTLSPDGAFVAYLAPFGRRKNIHVRKVGSDTNSAIRITEETARDITSFFWASNDRIVFVKDSGGDENFRLFAVNKDGSRLKDLTPFPDVTIQIIDTLEDSEEELIIGMNVRNPQLFEPYRINIHTGELTRLADNDDPSAPIVNWFTDHEGRLRLAIRMIDGVNERILYRPDEDAPFEEVITTHFKEGISPLFFDFEDKHVIFAASNLGRDKMAIVRYHLLERREIDAPLFEHPAVDVTQLHYSRKQRCLTAAGFTTWKQQLHFFDPAAETRYHDWKNRLGDYEISIVGKNKAETRFLLRTFSDRSLGAYYLYDTTTEQLEHIATISPWLEEDELASMQPVQFTSRDGWTLNGYLTLPRGQEPKQLPTIINPHGGPWVRDTWGYNPEVQLLAYHGFAVLQINFRSSSGYGRQFWEAGFGQWGLAMQDDITDGVQWLIKEGITNPARIAIYGGSYGGYATLAGITFTPNLYACAIDFVGVSNLFTFMKTIPPYWAPYLEMLYEMVGHPEKDEERMRATSPVYHVDNIRTPLFVVQGANDPRVNIDESDQIVASLRNRGVDVPYLVRYDEGHGFVKEENRFCFYKAMLGFLSK